MRSRAEAVTLIGLYPWLSSSEIELFCRFLITLSISVKITLGGSAVAWLISGQQPLWPWLLLAVLLPAKCVYVWVLCGCGVYKDFIFAFCPLWSVCTCVPAMCFLLSLWRGVDSLALLCMSTCCMHGGWLIARPPHLSSVSSPHFLSARAHRKASLMSGWLSKGLFIAAYRRSFARFRHGSFFFQSIWRDWSVQADCNWFLASTTAQLIEIAFLNWRKAL